jgi:hypothetical protein
MAIVVDDNIPDFLREFLISQGVISVKDTETGETAVVPLQPRRRQRLNAEGGMEGDFEEGSPITTAASGDFLDTLRGLFFSDTSSSEVNDGTYTQDQMASLLETLGPFVQGPAGENVGIGPVGQRKETGEQRELLEGIYNLPSGTLDFRFGVGNYRQGQSVPDVGIAGEFTGPQYFLETPPQSLAPQSSGNSVLDGAVNLFSGFGNFVDNSLSKLGGLFSGGISNPFDFDFTPSIDDRYGPMGPLSGAATAFMDDNLSTDRKVGQIIGGLGAGLGLAAIPGGTVLGLLSAGLGRMGAHHDFNPSTDYNLNFDTRSGRTDWGSTTDGAGGSQYGSLSNENMIEDIAKDNPDYEISLNEGKDGYITAEQWVDVNNALKNDPFAEGINPSEAFSAFADSSGDMFQSFGGGTLGEALTEYGQTGTGAIMNEAGAIADKLGLGYTETSTLADEIAAAAEQGVPMGLLGVDALDLDMSMGDLDGGDSGGGSFDFDMGDMGFGEGDFGTDGII